MPRNTDLWCPEIYHGLNIEPWNSDKISYGPCCNSDRKITDIDTFNFATDTYLTDLRQKFDMNQRPSECHRCWVKEDTGQQSRRMDMIDFYGSAPRESVPRLESIDYFSSWACNLACVICSPYFSSTWAQQNNLSKTQLVKMGRLFRNNNFITDKLDLSAVKKVHFNGGEPLINDDHVKILEQLEQQGSLGHTSISYNTNGTCFPTQKLIDLWSKCKFVRIYFSIDGIGDVFEYIRWPGKWIEVSKNMLEMKKHLPSNVGFGFHTAVGLINVLDLKPVIQWFMDNLSTNREGDQSNFAWQPMKNFEVGRLGNRCKQDAIEHLKSLPLAQGIISYIENNMQVQQDDLWITVLDNLDAKRHMDWRQTLSLKNHY